MRSSIILITMATMLYLPGALFCRNHSKISLHRLLEPVQYSEPAASSIVSPSISDDQGEVVLEPTANIPSVNHNIWKVLESISTYISDDPNSLAQFSLTSKFCNELVSERLRDIKAGLDVENMLDPSLGDYEFLHHLHIISQCLQSRNVMTVLRRQLTPSNVIYLARRLCTCNSFNFKMVYDAVNFLINQCQCKSLAGFMIGEYMNVYMIRRADMALMLTVLKPHFDPSVLSKIPAVVCLSIGEISPNSQFENKEFVLPESLQTIPNVHQIRELILKCRPHLVRGNAEYLAALSQIGVVFSLDIDAWPDLTPAELRVMGPYLRGTDFITLIPRLIIMGKRDLLLEIFRHRSLVRYCIDIYPTVLYLFCHLVLEYELPDVLDCFLGTPQIYSRILVLAGHNSPDKFLADAVVKLAEYPGFTLPDYRLLFQLYEQLQQALCHEIPARPQYL